MQYLIHCIDTEDSRNLRSMNRERHIKHVNTLIKSGNLIMAGPLYQADSNICGSVIIAEFESLKDAENWSNNDPYKQAGVYKVVSINQFKKFLPKQ